MITCKGRGRRKTAESIIKKVAPKPSDAITAMVKGLRKMDRSPNMKVSFSRYLDFDVPHLGVLCAGCAATGALMDMLPIDVKKAKAEFDGTCSTAVWDHAQSILSHGPDIQVKASETETLNDIGEFEWNMNEVRRGHLDWLSDYYQLKGDKLKKFESIGEQWKKDYKKHELIEGVRWKPRLRYWTVLANRLRAAGL